MPEKYIAMFNTPQSEEARQIVARAEPDIDRMISAIAANQALPQPRKLCAALRAENTCTPLIRVTIQPT